MKCLIVVPARGGSKGIPNKNIYKINGKPLLTYTLEALVNAEIDADVVVSTDSNKIADVASNVKNIKVIKRPDEISADSSKTEEALIHALDYMKNKYNKEYDVIVTAQPTSPLRKPETIRAFINEFKDNYDEFDAQITYTETTVDLWRKNESGEFVRLFPNAPRRRQEREILYVENSMLYITKVNALRQYNSVLGSRAKGFIIDNIESVDINDLSDIQLAEYYINMEV